MKIKIDELMNDNTYNPPQMVDGKALLYALYLLKHATSIVLVHKEYTFIISKHI